MKISIESSAITYVMYVDDIVLFYKTCRRDAISNNDCLDKYCNWSGQLVNRNKFGILFSRSTLN